MLASALLGESPPTMPVRRLVRVAKLFGINENRARVALSRMSASGEVVADGAGGYTLAGRLLERAERLAVSRTAMTSSFDGSWHLVVVTAAGDTAATRRSRRAGLRAARLGEVRDGVWARPANLELMLDATTTAATTRFVGATVEPPGELAARVFDLEGWARRASRLTEAIAAFSHDRPSSLAAGFELDAEVLRHLQRDPLIPLELLPERWPGPRLRAAFDSFDVAYRDRLRVAHHTAGLASPGG